METMKDIKARFASAKEGEYNALFRHYENDERSGVQKLIQQYHKKLQALEDERVRTESMKKYEHEYEHLGYLCGIDEVGRGPSCRTGSRLCGDPSERLRYFMAE